MLLDRFMMSSDHDGQKEADSLDIQFTVQSFSLPAYYPDVPYKYQDFTAPKGTYFATIVMSDSLFPGKMFPVPSARFYSGDIQYGIFAFRIDDTHYRIWATHQLKTGVSSGTVPTHTVRARLKFYVASKSD